MQNACEEFVCEYGEEIFDHKPFLVKHFTHWDENVHAWAVPKACRVIFWFHGQNFCLIVFMFVSVSFLRLSAFTMPNKQLWYMRVQFVCLLCIALFPYSVIDQHFSMFL